MLHRGSLFFFPQTKRKKEKTRRHSTTLHSIKNKVLPNQKIKEHRLRRGRLGGREVTYQPGRSPESGALGLYHWVLRYLPASHELDSEFG